MFEEEHKLFSQFLEKHNLRSTSQRLLILDVFLKSTIHLSAEELYRLVKKEESNIGQATVYRILKILVDANIAEELKFGEDVTRYERQTDRHHDHLICESCQEVIEVLDPQIEQLQEKLAQRYAYRLTSHRMYLYGVCSICSNK
jgi:Fur family transcriptional regulator, ferric uptake regulator